MTIKNGKIIKATEVELFEHYLKCDWEQIMPFTEYKRRCIEQGIEIVEKDSVENGR